jgi:hypothetical protein
MTLASDVGAYLAAQGLGTVGTDIFYYEFPDSPANCICIIPFATRVPRIILGGTDNIDYPGVQVQVRNTSKSTAESNAETIRETLHLAPISNVVQCVTTRSHPVFLGKDESNPRYRFSVDFEVTKMR